MVAANAAAGTDPTDAAPSAPDETGRSNMVTDRVRFGVWQVDRTGPAPRGAYANS